MTLGEILPHNRSLVPMHIVLMFRDEDFKQIGQEKVLSSLVSDLKYLEDSVFQSDGTIYLFFYFFISVPTSISVGLPPSFVTPVVSGL